MMDPSRFADYVQRLRAGDVVAAEQLVREYEPVLRMEIRARLRDPSLKRHFDSEDVCQSVLASFFVRVTAGQFDLEDSSQLLRLLVTMARNKVASATRKGHRECRDTRRISDGADLARLPIIDPDPTPGQIAEGRDLLAQVQRRLNEEERQLADLRALGHNWPEIAARLGGTAEGRRKQLTRALDRITQELGLEEEGDGE